MIKQLLKDVEVEWRPLGEVAELKRGTTITAASRTNGTIPVVSGGQTAAYYHGESNREGETITIAGSGAYAGFVMYWNSPIFVSDAFSIISDTSKLIMRYIYHFLLMKQSLIYGMQKGAGIPHVYPKDLSVLQIPIPTIPVQKEIVRILDAFTALTQELTKELTKELTARKKQYNYYRDNLLSFQQGDVEWKTLGEVGEFIRGNGLGKKDFVEDGFPAVHYGQIYTKYGLFADKTFSFVTDKLAQKLRIAENNDLLIATTSENDEDVLKCVGWLGEKAAISGDMLIFRHKQNVKYLAYCFQTEIFQQQKRKYITGTKVRRVSRDSLEKLTIPIPPLAEQERIVAILDKFDALTTSISDGLPREIALRQKQYEYYRDLLLNFPKPDAA